MFLSLGFYKGDETQTRWISMFLFLYYSNQIFLMYTYKLMYSFRVCARHSEIEVLC